MKYQKLVAAFLAIGCISATMFVPAAYAEGTKFNVKDICPAASIRYKEVESGKATGEAALVTSIAECNIPAKNTETSVMETVKTIINVVLSVVGILAVAAMVIGGINFVVSQGDSAKVTKARNTILYGLVGLVVSLLAFAIVNFVLSTFFTSSDQQQQEQQESPEG